jgi:hypothetical protein
MFASSFDYAATWTADPATLYAAPDVSYLGMSCDGSGAVYVFFTDKDESGRYVYLYASRDSGRTGTEDPVCVSCDATGDMPAIRNDEVGRVYVVFRSAGDPYPTLRISVSEDHGRTFGESVVITDPGAFPSPVARPRIAATANGHVIVLSEDVLIGWQSIWTTYSTDYGKTWSGDVRLDTGTYIATQSVLACDRYGNFHVAWTDWSTHAFYGDIFYNRGIPAVDLRIEGTDWPVLVPQGGETLDLELSVTNRKEETIAGVPAFLDAEIRPGRIKGPLQGPVPVDLLPGVTRRKPLSWGIPAGLRPGLYHLRMNLGTPVGDRAVLPIRIEEE